MSYNDKNVLIENEQYCFSEYEDKSLLLFEWRYVEGLSIMDFRKGITEFADQCRLVKPTYAVIDAAKLDQSSPAVAWLRSQDTNKQEEKYLTWWVRDIVPVYHDAEITSLAVGTGDPNAPGKLKETPPGVKFMIGYFPDLESALNWKPY